jgi:hypothetical protein
MRHGWGVLEMSLSSPFGMLVDEGNEVYKFLQAFDVAFRRLNLGK